MNKYQKALDNLLLTARRTKDVNIIQELVDRATPKKGKVTSLDCRCPECDYVVGNNNGWTQLTVKYCHKCSQAIEWIADE